jgi:hypothetical protein
VLAALGGSRLAQAEAATEPIRIEYHAEPGCPSADEFNAQVFRRTTSARLVTSGDTVRTFNVSISRRGSSLEGSLFVRQMDGKTESREVAGPDCREVATVLALATALAIDPQASLAPEAKSEPAAPPESAQPAASAGARGGGRSSGDAASTDLGPSDDEDDTSSGERAPWVLALGPAAAGGVTPRAAFGAGAAFGWRSRHARSALSAMGAEFVLLKPASHRVGTARSSFQLLYARPSLCSVALAWQAGSGVAPCFGGELGAVSAEGSDITHPESRTRIWATIDIALRLHQRLGSAWFVEAEASAVVPLTRYRYTFRDPETRIYTVPSVAVLGELRFGAHLW